jgi:hypothetical protein
MINDNIDEVEVEKAMPIADMIAQDKEDIKRGRKKFILSDEQLVYLKKLAMLQCTYEEIGSFFDCDGSTICKNYRYQVEAGWEMGKISLRRKQWRLADSSAAMAIFLGKQYLNQTDKVSFVDKELAGQEIGLYKEEDHLTKERFDGFYN